MLAAARRGHGRLLQPRAQVRLDHDAQVSEHTLSASSEPSAPPLYDRCALPCPASPRLVPTRLASPRFASPRPSRSCSYIDNASKRLGFPNGSTGPERNAFNFYQATQPEDFDNSRWAPGPSRAHEILSGMLAEAPGAELRLLPLPLPLPLPLTRTLPLARSSPWTVGARWG